MKLSDLLTGFTCLFMVICFQKSDGQTQESFEQTPWPEDTSWAGDTSHFRANANRQLRLDAPDQTGLSRITTSRNPTVAPMEWELWVRMDFSPSSNNKLRIYLSSDTADLSAPVNGYFLEIGENGSDDGIDLYRQDGTSHQMLIQSKDGIAAKNDNRFRILVNRNTAGTWTLKLDTLGGQKFIKTGEAVDTTYPVQPYFGLLCDYTSTRSDRFYFDALYAGPPRIDTIPPQIEKAKPLAKDSLKVIFSETVEAGKAEDPELYRVNKGIGKAKSAQRLSQATNEVLLTFDTPFANKTRYQLLVDSATDLEGNTRTETDTGHFTFFQAEPGDLLINELIPDPTPSQGLPEAEFVELYNATNFPANLGNWSIADETSTAYLPDSTLPPDSFAILCNHPDEAQFSPYGMAVPLASLPSLNNSGDRITIQNPKGDVIDEIEYDDNWFENPDKSDGGWSLERINPVHPCGGEANWKGSENPEGGTPGMRNSVDNLWIDSIALQVSRVEAQDSVTVALAFNESLDTNAVHPQQFSIPNGPKVQEVLTSNEEKLMLKLQNPLTPNDTHQLVYSGIRDCWGNEQEEDAIEFEYLTPQKATQNDLMIHEIMANPEPPVELPPYPYLELKNVSDKILSLENWVLADNTGQTSLPEELIQPDSLLILCDQEAEEVFQAYGDVSDIPSLPRLNVTGERLTLKNKAGQTIFSVNYQRSWYDDDLKAEGGWSLEMVDAKNPCGEAGNWAASENGAGGTPGMGNSVDQYRPDQTPPELERVAMKDSATLLLFLNEKLDSLATLEKAVFDIQPDDVKIQSIVPQPPHFSTIHLRFPKSPDPNKRYTVQVDSLVDCSGNVQTEIQEASFGLPSQPDSLSLVINEILFNPKPNGADYVEIYNLSNQVIDLQNLYWASLDDAYQLENPVPLTEAPLQLLPDQYLAFTDDAAHVRNNYHVKNPDQLFELESLPTWPNEAGHVLLVNEKGQKIDRVDYSADWHMDMLNNESGVSLERIAFEGPSNKPANWHSAATEAGFGTPTYENSQHGEPKAQNSPVKVAPKAFSPDQDGYKDFVNIQYELEKPGYMVNVNVYDAKGRPVTTLAHNQSVGKAGKWKWDGAKAGGGKAAIGTYILFIEFFHPQDGDKQVYKKAVTLSP